MSGIFSPQTATLYINKILGLFSAADPGFSRGGGGGRQLPGGGGGAPTYDFAKFSQKLHEIERIWMPGGGGGGRAPCAPPPKSATDYLSTN